MVTKKDIEREIEVVLDAIQYWKGFFDALQWCKENLGQDLGNLIDEQFTTSESMLDAYRQRLLSLKTKKEKNNARRK